MARGIGEARLPGRFQRVAGPVETVLDVAHNPDAAGALAAALAAHSVTGRTRCVLAMLEDKDTPAFVRALAPQVHAWHVAGLDVPRGLTAPQLAARLGATGVGPVQAYDDVATALAAARAAALPGDRIVVTGSFHTVAAALPGTAPRDSL